MQIILLYSLDKQARGLSSEKKMNGNVSTVQLVISSFCLTNTLSGAMDHNAIFSPESTHKLVKAVIDFLLFRPMYNGKNVYCLVWFFPLVTCVTTDNGTLRMISCRGKKAAGARLYKAVIIFSDYINGAPCEVVICF